MSLQVSSEGSVVLYMLMCR